MSNPWDTQAGRWADLEVRGPRPYCCLGNLRDEARKWLQRRGWTVSFRLGPRRYYIERLRVEGNGGRWQAVEAENIRGYDAALVAAILLAKGDKA